MLSSHAMIGDLPVPYQETYIQGQVHIYRMFKALYPPYRV